MLRSSRLSTEATVNMPESGSICKGTSCYEQCNISISKGYFWGAGVYNIYTFKLHIRNPELQILN